MNVFECVLRLLMMYKKEQFTTDYNYIEFLIYFNYYLIEYFIVFSTHLKFPVQLYAR